MYVSIVFSSSQPGAGDEGELEKSAMIPEAPQSETTDETAADQTVADQATETQRCAKAIMYLHQQKYIKLRILVNSRNINPC